MIPATIRSRRARALALAALSLPTTTTLPAAPLDPAAFPSLGTLNLTSGTLNINTDTLAITGAASFTGTTFDQGPSLQNGIADFDRTLAVFDFASLNIGPSVTLNVTGSRPLAILSRSTLAIAAPINLSTAGSTGGPAGGGTGGPEQTRGTGPGSGSPGPFDVGGAAFGGAGGAGEAVPPGTGQPGIPYGDLLLRLQGGSGGSGGGTGASPSSTGAGGAGAIELGALSSITLAAPISATGGSSPQSSFGAGGGSGGGILLHAPALSFSSLNVTGGNGGLFGGAGGGGRIAVVGLSLSPTQLTSLLSSPFSLAGGTSIAGGSGAAGLLAVRADTFAVPAAQNSVLSPSTPSPDGNTPAVNVSTLFLSVPATATATLAGNNFVDPTAGTATVDGTLALGAYSQSLAALAGNGTVSFAGGTLSLGAANLSSTLANTLTGTGTLSKIGAGALTITHGGPGITLAATAGSLVVRATAADAASFSVAPTATLQITSNARLLANGIGPAATNAGTLIVDSNSTLESTNPLTNTGTITGKDATLRFTGGLANAGALEASAAPDIYGPVSNLPGGSITVKGGNTTAFHSPLTAAANSSLSVATASTLFLSAGVTGSGSLDNSGNTRIEAGPSSLSSVTGGGTLSVSSPATLTLNSLLQSSLTVQGLITLSPGGGPSETSTLSIPTGGSLDLNNNPFTLDYATTSPLDTVRQHLLAARIRSTTAVNDPQHRLAIAYAESSSLPLALRNAVAGLPVDDTAVLLKLTYLGDANLDGRVNADDYALLDRGLAKHLTTWQSGDFNYDGQVTSADYLLIDRTLLIQAQGLETLGLLAQRESQFGTAYVTALLASVPEPTSAVACLFAVLSTRRRTRR